VKQSILGLNELEDLIIGRVTPRVYAFTTNTVPNYTKVGDTYRPVSLRLKEWSMHYPGLEKTFEDKAMVSEDIYFRDFSVHSYLENDLEKPRLTESEFPHAHYSREFFRETSSKDIKEAIDDIKINYEKNTDKYTYYRSKDRLPEVYEYSRGESWELRPNQKEAVENFIKAIKSGRKNLLMYAVMRFGKSFTSLCCAKAMDAKLVVVVSAKADVKEEWKKTVESAGNFKNYVFLTEKKLKESEKAIKEVLEEGKTAVVFLTLQDLQGEEKKDKHREVFESQIDLLIVDETHFGARAESFGAVLMVSKSEQKYLTKLEDECVLQDEADEVIKTLNSKVRIHLSGTPYRILMGGEFQEDDIISFVQFPDIVNEKEKWDEENLMKDGVEEWDNPYYGFPQMIRFAFMPNESSIEKMRALKESGVSIGLTGLFSPQSIRKDNRENKHRKFINENEVLALLKAIDGTEQDENIFPFLDYDKIKKGQMCRHMVMVLPRCASCDAMEELLIQNKENFKHLGEYQIVNISGLDAHNKYPEPSDIKRTIKQLEKENKKTITLTVNRMLTGSTVEEWDTMIFLKDTASPQEYDQAIFRLQNQFIRTLYSEAGAIKENKKPQTLLVDFSPHRLFSLQEQKSLIFNANIEERGNLRLKERIDEELHISPVITMNQNQIQRVKATDILKHISQYNSERSISDEVTDIPFDFALLNNELIKEIIARQADFNSKEGLSFDVHEGEERDLDVDKTTPEIDDSPAPSDSKEDYEGYEEEEIDFCKKFQTYYQRILFYTFLIDKQIYSLDDIIKSIPEENNKRILKNLGLREDVLIEIAKHMDPFVRNALDYKIQNISNLSFDETKTALERAETSLNKFNRLSESEIITPKSTCDEMVALIPEDGFKRILENGEVFLDIASKAAEYPVAIYKRLIGLGYKHDEIKDRIFAIPTSPPAYELTRKFYEILGLNTDNIAKEFTSYDLLDIKDEKANIDYDRVSLLLRQNKPFNEITLKEDINEGGERVKFGAVVGNPPYNVRDGGAAASAKPIYHEFVLLSKKISTNYMSFVTPTRWFAGGKGLDSFRDQMLSDNTIRELHDVLTPEDIFPGTNNRGGICYYLMDSEKISNVVRVVTHRNNKIVYDKLRTMKQKGIDIFIRDSIGVLIAEKIFKLEHKSFSDIVSSRKPFGLEGNLINSTLFKKSKKGLLNPVKCYGKANAVGFIEKELITKNISWIDSWKVYAPYANNIGTELNDDNQNSFVGEPSSASTETFLVFGADLDLSETSANYLSKYMKTKFARFLHGLSKISQHGTKQTYRFVPMQDFTSSSDIVWSKSIDEVDEQLFDKYGLTEEEKTHIKTSIKKMD